jgi:hypothetical protein
MEYQEKLKQAQKIIDMLICMRGQADVIRQEYIADPPEKSSQLLSLITIEMLLLGMNMSVNELFTITGWATQMHQAYDKPTLFLSQVGCTYEAEDTINGLLDFIGGGGRNHYRLIIANAYWSETALQEVPESEREIQKLSLFRFAENNMPYGFKKYVSTSDCIIIGTLRSLQKYCGSFSGSHYCKKWGLVDKVGSNSIFPTEEKLMSRVLNTIKKKKASFLKFSRKTYQINLDEIPISTFEISCLKDFFPRGGHHGVLTFRFLSEQKRRVQINIEPNKNLDIYTTVSVINKDFTTSIESSTNPRNLYLHVH